MTLRLKIFLFLFFLYSTRVYSGGYIKDKCSTSEFHLKALTQSSNFSYDPVELTQWFQSNSSSRPNGIVFILHGLNNRPSSMNPFQKLARSLNFIVLRGSLTGHRGDLEEFKQVKHIKWMEDIFHHFCLLDKKSKELKVPLFFIGYSLGALTTLDYFIHEEDPIPFQKMILLAPALRSHSYLTALSWFDWFRGSVLIPSRNLKGYRFYKSTPLSAYRALYQSQKQVQSDLLKRASVETLLFLHPKDELVSLKKIKKLMKWSYLKRWKLISLNNNGHKLEKKINHLILDEKSLGPKEWGKVETLVKKFLLN